MVDQAPCNANIGDPDLTYDDDPEPFRAGMFRFGAELGAQQSGVTPYELPPGRALCPCHYEYGEEEWLLVVSGVRVLMWSTIVLPTATVYPDSDKVGIWTGNRDDDMLVRRSSAVEHYDGEV